MTELDRDSFLVSRGQLMAEGTEVQNLDVAEPVVDGAVVKTTLRLPALLVQLLPTVVVVAVMQQLLLQPRLLLPPQLPQPPSRQQRGCGHAVSGGWQYDHDGVDPYDGGAKVHVDYPLIHDAVADPEVWRAGVVEIAQEIHPLPVE